MSNEQLAINEQIKKTREKMLRGNNIYLRAVEPGDVDFILRMENDQEVWQVGNTIVPFSRFQIEQYALSSQHNIYVDKQLRLMIDLLKSSQNNKTIGTVDLYDFDPHHQRAGVGILIIKEERGKGFASETLELLIRYCFDVLMLHQLYCTITPDNTVSMKLFKKHGFIKTGVKKEWRLQEGKWTDEIIFQLIKKQKYQKEN